MNCEHPPQPFEFKDMKVRGRLFRIHDGDSFRALIEHHGDIICLTIRLMGIDCPEISARPGTFERELAEQAKSMVKTLAEDKLVTLTLLGNGKYGGRVLAGVELADGRDLTTVLITAGLAFPYDGGKKRRDWESLRTPLPLPPGAPSSGPEGADPASERA